MTLLLDILDWIFIFVLGLPVLYLFVFAAASTRARKDTYPPARLQRRFVTLIPAYKSDAVIVHAAQSALQQDYPQELHEVVVIADRLQPATLAELRRMPIRVLEASFENSSKARALNFAVGEIGPDGAEAVAMALPDEQADARLGHALRRMPVLFLLTLANLFRLRGTKDKFIHTEHTGAGSEAPGNNTGNRP